LVGYYDVSLWRAILYYEWLAESIAGWNAGAKGRQQCRADKADRVKFYHVLLPGIIILYSLRGL
jgi:hypothetical protein